MKKEKTYIKSLETTIVDDQATATLVARTENQEATISKKGNTIGQAVNRCLGWFHSRKWIKTDLDRSWQKSIALMQGIISPAAIDSLLGRYWIDPQWTMDKDQVIISGPTPKPRPLV